MSSRQDPYYYSDTGTIYYESDPESPVTRLHSPGQYWPSTATTHDESGYSNSQLPQSSVHVGNLSGVDDVEDTNYSFSYPGHGYSLTSTPSQDLGVGTDATYTNDNVPFDPFANSSFYPYPELDGGLSQHQHTYTPYVPVYDPSPQHLVHDAHQLPPQTPHDSQTLHVPLEPVYAHSSPTQLLSLGHNGPVSDSRAASSTPEGLDTARANSAASQHSHLSPVELAFTNQTAIPGPSHPVPRSPDRKRLLPWSADDDYSTGRRVARRHDAAWNVHATSSGSQRRGRSSSDVIGRGPLIPQERYTTSSISAFNAPDQLPVITFNLENPDQIGIPIIDIQNKTNSFARLRDRTQAYNMEKKTFTLRVQWPGYKPWSKTIAALDWTKSRAPITRVKLAEAVATAIRDLFEKYRDEPCDQDYAMWNLGRNGIQLEQICLVALHHVSKGSWQPELCLLGPRQ